MQNRIPSRIREISCEQVATFEAQYGGGHFYIVRMIIQPFEDADCVEWWQVHRDGTDYKRRMISHAPTFEAAIEQFEWLNNQKYKPFQRLKWNLPLEEKQKIQELSKQIAKEQKIRKDELTAKQIAEHELQKAIEEELAKQQEIRAWNERRIQKYKETVESQRFVGINV